MTGVIVDIIENDTFSLLDINDFTSSNEFTLHFRYEEIDPFWRNKPMYVVKFDSSQRPLTREECLYSLPRGWSEEQAQQAVEILYMSCPNVRMCKYIEAELELI